MAEQEDAKNKGHDASKDDLKYRGKTHIPSGKRMNLPYPLHTHPFRKEPYKEHDNDDQTCNLASLFLRILFHQYQYIFILLLQNKYN